MTSSSVDERLHAAERSIHIATRQAYAALMSSSQAIEEVVHDNDHPIMVDDNRDGNNSNSKNILRVGMDVGLKLFGTSQSYRNQIEEEFHEKLRTVEKELVALQSDLELLVGGTNATKSTSKIDDGGENQPWSSSSLTFSSRKEGSISAIGSTDNDGDIMSITRINDVSHLQAHIEFLQQCAKARKLLEEVDTLALMSNYCFSTESVSGSSSSQQATKNSMTSFLYSPSSICSPSDFMRCTNMTDDNIEGNETAVSPMVKAAQFVSEACELLENIMDSLSSREEVVPEKNNQGMMRMQSKMLHELQHQARCKKMELRYRAMTIIEGCIVVEWDEKGSLLVRGSSASNSARPSDGKKKTVTFDIVASPPPATNCNEIHETPSSPLSDAYRVLQLFSDARFPSFGETLNGAMKRISMELLSVIRPCLAKLSEHAPTSTTTRNSNGKEEIEVGYYKFTQQTLNSTRLPENRYDPISIKGSAVQLQWMWIGVPVVLGNKNDGNANANSGRNFLSTAGNIDEGDIQSMSAEISPSMATFLSSLNFITNLFAFVFERVLLRRSDLANMLGKHLFGTYPLPDATISSGSAILSNGGVVLGAAALRLESGEEMPLMYELMKSMRRHCVCAARSLETWRLLQKMEQCLVEEIASFENKLVEFGLLKDASATTATLSMSTTECNPSTSPNSFQILVDETEVARSIGTSKLDATLPSSEHHFEQANQHRIVSPLSELATSLRQAYIEGQRSLILNEGRDILMNTDYHNTIQVGTFVPEPSDAGTLASLDDDPLTAFALHQCSISTAAQHILSLCRKTLDDATNSDVTSDLVDDAFSPMMFRAARDLLDLFRAIIPTTHASEIGTIPRMAAVLHNDCVYLAHESSLLGAEYKGKFHRLHLENYKNKSKTKSLGEICSFMDMVPLFRDLATKSMGSMIEMQKGQLFELVSPRLTSFEQALSSNESVTEWDDADTALRASLHHLRHLSQAWKKVLARDVYQMSMGNLIDLVFTLFLDPVLKAGDITEFASRFVNTLFLDAIRGVADLFLVDSSVTGTIETAPLHSEFRLQRSFQVAKKYSNLFDKAQAVGQFMCMRLDEIQRGLEEGVFRSVTARELSHLIISAFDDSSKRSTLLNELAVQDKKK